MNNIKDTIKDEEGSTIIIALVVLVLITIIGLAALNDTDMELKIAGNEKNYKRDFYNAENGLNRAVANFQSIYNADQGGIRTSSPDSAACTFDYNDGDGNPVVRIEIKAITTGHDDGNGNQIPYDTDALDDKAENVPLQAHIGPSPSGFGENFRSRRYAITAIAIDPVSGKLSNTWVQGGANVAEELESVNQFIGTF